MIKFTLNDIIADTLIVLNGSTISDDLDLSEEHIAYKFMGYRARNIQDFHQKNRRIIPAWLQRIGIWHYTKVNSADEPTLYPGVSICLGKKTLPSVVALERDMGYYRVTSPSRQRQIYPIDMHAFFQMYENNDERIEQFDYYFIEGESIYKYPYEEEGAANVILENPLQGWKYTTEKIISGNIIAGKSYTVYEHQIQYNGIIYNPGNSFTGISGITTFTGTGIVRPTIESQLLTYDDKFPIDQKMTNEIMLEMLVNYFGIERKMISDIVNDAQNQLRILQNFSA